MTANAFAEGDLAQIEDEIRRQFHPERRPSRLTRRPLHPKTQFFPNRRLPPGTSPLGEGYADYGSLRAVGLSPESIRFYDSRTCGLSGLEGGLPLGRSLLGQYADIRRL